MKSQMRILKITDDISLRCFEDDKFKHNRLTINFIIEARRENAAVNALIPLVLKLGSGEYRTITEINRKLCDLYGAVLSADISKYGKYQVIDVSVISIDDKFSMDSSKNILQECAKLLCSVVFKPLLFSGDFSEQMLDNEKKFLEDTINSEINDKQFYAIYKCKQQICKNEPYGINKYGYIDDIKKIDKNIIKNAYKNILNCAKIEIMFVGHKYDEKITEILKENLNFHRNSNIEVKREIHVRNIDGIISEEEIMDLSQEKLVLGFDFSEIKTEEEINCIRLFAYIFGNSSNSKLFKSIREDLNLCYYCSANIDTFSGIFLVDCGIEKENNDKVAEEILRQFDLCRGGDISEEELAEAKLALVGEITETEDFVDMTEDWYMSRIMTGHMLTPEEQRSNLEKIKKEDIVRAVNKMKHCSVFALK